MFIVMKRDRPGDVPRAYILHYTPLSAGSAEGTLTVYWGHWAAYLMSGASNGLHETRRKGTYTLEDLHWLLRSKAKIGYELHSTWGVIGGRVDLVKRLPGYPCEKAPPLGIVYHAPEPEPPAAPKSIGGTRAASLEW